MVLHIPFRQQVCSVLDKVYKEDDDAKADQLDHNDLASILLLVLELGLILLTGVLEEETRLRRQAGKDLLHLAFA